MPESKSDHISAHYDMLATFSDIAGYELPEGSDGISMLPTLLAKEHQREHEFLYWEFPSYGGQVAIRMGDWKIVRQHLKDNNKESTVELYNLREDPAETTNLANDHPEILDKAAQIFDQERTSPELENFKIPVLADGLFNE